MLDFSVTFVITLINLALLFFILRALLFKPVTKFMENRAKKIADALAGADQSKLQAQQLLNQYEEQMKKAGEEADRIIKSARESGERQAAEIIAAGKAQAEQLLVNTRSQLEAERQAALALFRAEAAALIVSASGRLLKRELQGGDEQRYARMLLEELASGKVGR